MIKRLPVKYGMIDYEGSLVPAKPMIGVIGVAPMGEPVGTMTPMDHGGNMDCTRIEEGATLYLPVSVEGAQLSVGDFHAVMGEGEVANCGVEIEGRAVLEVDVLKSTGISWPMVENLEQWITIAYGDTLDGCRDADGYGGGSDGLPDRQSQKDGADGGAQVAGGEAGQIIHHGPK